MREIKFRAWDKQSNKWASPCNIRIDGYGNILWQFGYDEKVCDSSNFDIQMFTGLKDKNGKEIYEGDIVEFNSLEIGNTGLRIAEIVYTSFGTRFSARTEYGDKQFYGEKYIEVIGNIYENLELIESQTPTNGDKEGK